MKENTLKNVLIIGSGGREHAIAWKISQSPLLANLYVCPGNSGTGSIAKNINCDINNNNQLKELVFQKNIDVLIVGPEQPLVNGLVDDLRADKKLSKLIIVGPEKKGAKLEGSKEFAKNFMTKYHIPTARFKSFNKHNNNQITDYLKSHKPPFVIKADGLAAGKGVFICKTLEEAKRTADDILINNKFGESGNKIVVESFLDGVELSMFILTDGNNYKILPSAKDYKRVGENDTGLNTGGMGAISPVPFLTKSLLKKIKKTIIEPTLTGLKREHIHYSGFLFFGLMNVAGEPFVIEFNVRLGDPETQAIMPRIQSDFLNLILNLANSNEFKKAEVHINPKSTATVILTSSGYPEKYVAGHVITGVDSKSKNSVFFHAGISVENNNYITSGGRVLAVTSLGENIKDAVKKSYDSILDIQFENLYFRKDIGYDLI